jgi:hypothetical protein
VWQGGGRPEEPPQPSAPQGEELPLRPVRPCLRLQPRPQAAHPLLSPGRDREVPHVSADNLGQLRVLGSVADPDPSDLYLLGLLDPDPLVRDSDPDPSIIKQK